MNTEKRIGLGPVPPSPEQYLNEIQVNGMIILHKFGWKLVCIRRQSIEAVVAVVRNGIDEAIGILGKDGVLRLSQDIRIRGKAIPEQALPEQALPKQALH